MTQVLSYNTRILSYENFGRISFSIWMLWSGQKSSMDYYAFIKTHVLVPFTRNWTLTLSCSQSGYTDTPNCAGSLGIEIRNISLAIDSPLVSLTNRGTSMVLPHLKDRSSDREFQMQQIITIKSKDYDTQNILARQTRRESMQCQTNVIIQSSSLKLQPQCEQKI